MLICMIHPFNPTRLLRFIAVAERAAILVSLNQTEPYNKILKYYCGTPALSLDSKEV